ncbi:MAG: DUF5683 domain-containing protein [Bacteroidales bacterium]
MTNTVSDISGKGIRRIVRMILLFAFLGVSLWGQGEEPQNDTVTDLRSFDLDRPVERNTPQGRSTLQQEAGRDTVPSSDRPSEPGIYAADDSMRMSAGKTKEEGINREDIEHSPTKAMTYALILPGLGQAYNKKYFKIPFVYGALGGVGYWIYYNTQGYRQSSANYTDDPTDFNERYLRLWRRQLELSYITLAAAYALQVLDAYVDAHLFHWDVNPDLTIRVEPSMEPLYMPVGAPASNYGITCKLTF